MLWTCSPQLLRLGRQVSRPAPSAAARSGGLSSTTMSDDGLMSSDENGVCPSSAVLRRFRSIAASRDLGDGYLDRLLTTDSREASYGVYGKPSLKERA